VMAGGTLSGGVMSAIFEVSVAGKMESCESTTYVFKASVVDGVIVLTGNSSRKKTLITSAKVSVKFTNTICRK